eukprot:CAMPEP_0206002314 /NCGR_PEP_ID=MMETSP1464-20131121/2667_1 /ASSEMBLY_ACC=CAM_ASM_001124 /TAXON_ID=119497 /ORGANISM="Exanthemachrysis gayraliae, Strain RCC1523" /LENGTH=364 /DNA_ID=CAMNT_0053375651 /DNA_START=1 /DNA_END=1091 /DNA_ORIENTATION=-
MFLQRCFVPSSVPLGAGASTPCRFRAHHKATREPMRNDEREEEREELEKEREDLKKKREKLEKEREDLKKKLREDNVDLEDVKWIREEIKTQSIEMSNIDQRIINIDQRIINIAQRILQPSQGPPTTPAQSKPDPSGAVADAHGRMGAPASAHEISPDKVQDPSLPIGTEDKDGLGATVAQLFRNGHPSVWLEQAATSFLQIPLDGGEGDVGKKPEFALFEPSASGTNWANVYITKDFQGIVGASLESNKTVLLRGMIGTGKSMLTLYKAAVHVQRGDIVILQLGSAPGLRGIILASRTPGAERLRLATVPDDKDWEALMRAFTEYARTVSLERAAAAPPSADVEPVPAGAGAEAAPASSAPAG